MKYLSLLALATALSMGCNNGQDDETDTDTDETDTETDIPQTLITVAGVAVDISTSAPVAEGLCVDIVDPTAAVTGGEAETVGTGTIGANGAFSVADIPTTAPFGMFVSIGDCEDATTPTVWTSLTGILAPSYQNLDNGATLEVTAASVNLELLAGIEDSLDAITVTESAQEQGAMIAWVRDSSGAALAGATVSCEGCGSFYYFDQDSSDGLFSSATGINAATDASGMLMTLAPPTSTYTPAADGYEFDGLLFGGSAGVATFVEFSAK